MTRGIEEALNLPSLEDAMKEHGLHPSQQPEAEQPAIDEDEDAEDELHLEAMQAEAAAKITRAADAVRKMRQAAGEDHANSMDTIHNEILRHTRDLMDLGFNLDHARARGIFEVAATMYKHAMDAKNSKRDMQLKAMKLALDQRKLELDERKVLGDAAEENTPVPLPASGQVVIEDRNELLKRLREAKKD